jgi:filamentous hemagglutinin family protein
MARLLLQATLGIVMVLAIAVFVGSRHSILLAQTTNITSSGLNTRVANPTSNPNITGGTRPGGSAGTNLFHSFGEFNIGTNQIATFLNSGSLDLAGNPLPSGLATSNIFSRVTGGNPSNIFGTIRTAPFGPSDLSFGTANLYLINPAGVLLGPTAQLNVGGSFTATSADYLKMTDGAKFYANHSQSSVLSIAPVTAFGFLSGNPASIAVKGSSLAVPNGQSISLIGGNRTYPDPTNSVVNVPSGVTMTGGGTLSALGGQVNLVSVGELSNVTTGAEVNANRFTPSADFPFSSMGIVSLNGSPLAPGTIDVSGTGGGSVLIRGGQLTLAGTSIVSVTTGNVDSVGLGIDIDVKGLVNIQPFSTLISSTTGQGKGADINIKSTNLNIEGACSFECGIVSNSLGGGNAGSVSITANGGDIIMNNAKISSEVLLDRDNPAVIPTGNAGHISISSVRSNNVGGDINLLFGNAISTSNQGKGNGGSIDIHATNLTLVGSGFQPRIESDAGFGGFAGGGTGGNINIHVDNNISLQDAAAITAFTHGSGNAGNIDITARTITMTNSGNSPVLISTNSIPVLDVSDNINMGNAGTVTLSVDQLTLTLGSIISSNSFENFGSGASGSAGQITIQGMKGAGSAATTVSLDSSTISTTTSGGSEGNAPASIGITSNTVNLSNFSKISADTSGRAPAGNITFNVDILTAALGSEISSSSLGNNLGDSATGNAGSIMIQGLSGSRSLATSLSLDNSTISTTIEGGSVNSNPASIDITAQTVNLANGTTILSNTSGAGSAGNITLNVDTLTASSSTIASDSLSTNSTAGNAGSITIQGMTGSGSSAADVRLDRFGEIRTQILGGSAANTKGAITINAETLALTDVSRLRADTVGAGPAGNITLNVGTLTAAGHSTISSDSSGLTPDGNAGNITIQGIVGPGSHATSLNLDSSDISTSVVGGSVAEKNAASIDITAHTLTLANNAQIRASTASAAPAGNITLNVDTLTAGNSSEISTSSFGQDATAGNAGSITIQGVTGSRSPTANLSLDTSTISTTIAGGNSTNTPAAISIAANDLSLTNASLIQADTKGPASAGNVDITAHTIDVNNLAGITSLTGGEGNAGSIKIKGQESVTIAGSFALSTDQVFSSTVASSSLEQASGNAGKVTIEAPAVTITDGGTLTTTTFGSGRGGDATVLANTLIVSNGGSISSGTFGSSGAGGSVSVTAHEAVSVTGHDQQGNKSSIAVASLSGTGDAGTLSVNSSALTLDGGLISALTTGDGKAGAIDLAVGSMAVLNDSQISTSTTFGKGEGGSLTIRGRQFPSAESLLISDSLIDSSTLGIADAGRVTIAANSITFDQDASLSASTGDPTGQLGTAGQGRAGNVVITGNTIQLLNGSIVDSSTFGAGSGGSIHIAASDQLLLTGRSQEGVSTIATVTAGSGNAGEIMVETPKLTLQQGTIFANTGTSGGAGTITVKAGELSLLDAFIASRGVREATGDAGAVNLQVSGLFSSQGSTVSSAAQQGAGGNVSITAGNVQLTSGTTVSAESAGPKDSGSITLTSGSDLFIQKSSVTTRADQASGGDIKLTAPNLVRIVDSTITSSVQGETGSNGGNINIDPQLVVIQNSQLLANANAGAGGNITVAATGAVLVDPNSVLSATAGPAGISGSVNINSPIQVLSGALVPMKIAYTQTGLSGDRCAADPKGQFSSFVQTGRDRAPQSPGGFASSPLGFLDTFETSALGSHQLMSQTVRLGLWDTIGGIANGLRFFSGCGS